MVKYNVYKRVRIYDYQAICKDKIVPSGPANFRTSPFHTLWRALGWVWKKLVMLVIHFEVYNLFRLEWIIASSDYSDYGDYPAEESIPIPSKTRPRPCDMEIDLYEMQPMEPEPIKGKLSKCSDRSCDKQFIVQSVPSSNLVMLVVFTDCNCSSQPTPLQPKEVVPDEAIFCNQSSLPRMRPDVCINYHAEEVELKQQCGRGHTLQGSVNPLLFLSLLLAISSSCSWVRDDRDPGIVPSLCASDCFFGTPHRHEREARLRRQRKENLQWCRPPWNSATSKRHHPVRSAPTP
ncbi:voltage-dependent calcium channel subunit alpha-2/delta-3 isoform X2 [Ixodes scapularis]